MARRPVIAGLAFASLLTVAAGVRLLVGGDPPLAWPTLPGALELRAARLAAGASVGAALGLAGVFLQSLLRNPLASPDLMGLSAGSGLAVTLATYIAYRAGEGVVLAPGAAQVPALIGSFAALALVYALSQRSWLIDPVAMVLMGVVVSFVLGAATVFVQHLLPDRGESGRRWLMGALTDGTPGRDIALLAGAVAVAFSAGLAFARDMDTAALGDDDARTAGVELARLRLSLFVASGVLTAGAVAVAGPLGFVGLIAPHLARLTAGPRHAGLLVSAGLAGATLVVGADTLVKSTDVAGGRLPIGVLTSVIGGPVFIWLLMRERASLRD